jgi:hypothetical protein
MENVSGLKTSHDDEQLTFSGELNVLEGDRRGSDFLGSVIHFPEDRVSQRTIDIQRHRTHLYSRTRFSGPADSLVGASSAKGTFSFRGALMLTAASYPFR